MAESASDPGPVLDDIRALSAAPAPLLDQVERTLTDGYACALAIESKQSRLRRRLQLRAAALGDSPASEHVGEVSDLAQGLARTEDELRDLRVALAELATIAGRLRG